MTWETVPLRDVVSELESGSRPRGGALADGVASIGGEHVLGTGRIASPTKFVSQVHFDSMRTGKLRLDDLLVVKDGATTGKVAVVRDQSTLPAAVNEHVFRLAVNPARAEPRYIFHFLYAPEGQREVLRDFRGATVGGIGRGFIDVARVPLPPLSEQRRIAAILDEADALRAKRSKSIALLDELPSIRFNSRHTTSWRKLTVGDVADLQGGLTVNARRAALPAVAAYLRVANVYRGSIDLGTLKEIGVSDTELSRTRLKRGDVLVVEGHGNLAEVGRAAMVDHLPSEPLTHQNHLFRLRARGGAVTGRFLELAINSPSSRENLRRAANTTSGLNTLNATSIRNLPILVAPLEEQHEIEAEFADAAAARSVAQRQKQDVDSLFASLQHRAFRGEL